MVYDRLAYSCCLCFMLCRAFLLTKRKQWNKITSGDVYFPGLSKGVSLESFLGAYFFHKKIKHGGPTFLKAIWLHDGSPQEQIKCYSQITEGQTLNSMDLFVSFFSFCGIFLAGWKSQLGFLGTLLIDIPTHLTCLVLFFLLPFVL